MKAREIAAAVAARKISAEEVASASLERITAYESQARERLAISWRTQWGVMGLT